MLFATFADEFSTICIVFSTITLPTFTVSANTEKSFNPFGQSTFTTVDGENADVLEQERKALEDFEVSIAQFNNAVFMSHSA